MNGLIKLDFVLRKSEDLSTYPELDNPLVSVGLTKAGITYLKIDNCRTSNFDPKMDQ
jgi:hypothetical protein